MIKLTKFAAALAVVGIIAYVASGLVIYLAAWLFNWTFQPAEGFLAPLTQEINFSDGSPVVPDVQLQSARGIDE